MTSPRPPGPPPVPAALRERYNGWTWTLAWQIVETQAVFRLTHPDGGSARFLKLATGRPAVPLGDEVDRLRWAGEHVPVPRVVEHGRAESATVAEPAEWVVTAALDGADATDPRWRTDTARLVRALAVGLRRFHEALPVERCPFDSRLDVLLDQVGRRVIQSRIDPAGFHPEHRHHSPVSALAHLRSIRPEETELVVCHGDYCVPNALLVDWEVTGYVDLGELGVADRWWDLATATWSLHWNLGHGWEAVFLAAYGVDPDPQRSRFYRLLYDLVS